MGKTNKKNTATKENYKDIVAKDERRSKMIRLWLIIFASVALVAIIGTVITVALVNYFNGKRVDFLKDDLSKYVYLSKEDYSSFGASVNIDPITETDVETALIRALCKHKDKDPVGSGIAYKNVPVSVGDIVYMHYRGYILADDGVRRVYFDGGCNFSMENDEDIAQEVGTNESNKMLYSGFEVGLLGKNPADYSQLNIIREGAVQQNQLILLEYSASFSDGTNKRRVSEVIDLGSDDLDKKYGVGFAQRFVGLNIGDKVNSFSIDDGTNEMANQHVYYDMTIKAAYETAGNPLVVAVHVPSTVANTEISGKTAYFEVYIHKAIIYNAPEANDAFVKDTLGFSEEDLSEFNGESLIDKYRSKLRKELTEQRDEAVNEILEDALFDHYLSKAKIIKLPKGDLEDYYRAYYNDLYTEYESGGGASVYGNFGAFVLTVYELDYDVNWEDHIMKMAEEAIKQKLVFYYVARAEGFLPDESEVPTLAEELLKEQTQAYLERTGSTEDSFDSIEEYERAFNRTKSELLSYYGEQYYTDNAYYTYALEKMLKFATIE